MSSAMTAYRSKLADYLRTQKVIVDNFFAAAAAAEAVCEESTHTALTNVEQNAAQAVFKSQFHDAHQVRVAALKALGPPPVMPISPQSNGNSHETHMFEPYGWEQELSNASLEKFI